jgi:hypothetical protein
MTPATARLRPAAADETPHADDRGSPTDPQTPDGSSESLWDSVTTASLTAAVPDLTFGLVCLATWFWADRMPSWLLSYIVLVMLLEFIVIHSSAFLGSMAYGDDPKKKSPKALLGLGGFYSLFVLGFCLAFKTAWPMLSFWGQTINRLMGPMLGANLSGRQRAYVRGMWAISGGLYFVGAFVCSLMPWPRLGVTYEIVAAANLSGEGLWIDEPWRPVVFGFFYFTGVGLFELFQERWLKHAQAWKPPITKS